jgi:tetratricopeptide (TPR) repeat protein
MVALVALCSHGAAADLTAEQARAELRQAFDLREEGRYADAIGLLEKVVAFDPSLRVDFADDKIHLVAIAELAIAHYQNGNWKAALPALEEYARYIEEHHPLASTLIPAQIAECRRQLARLGKLNEPSAVVVGTRYLTGEIKEAEKRLLVGASELAGALRLSVSTDAQREEVQLRSRTHTLVLRPGARRAALDGQPVAAELAPIAVDGQPFVPLRLVAESFGRKVAWDPVTRIAWVR